MTAPITLHIQPARAALQVSSEPQMVYLMVTGRAAATSQKHLPLNLCLVLDRSSSMRGERLFQVKEAARQVLSQMQSTDAFGLVAFNDRAEVIVPSQQVRDAESLKAQVMSLEARGGTEMAQGLALGLQEIERPKINGISRLVLLTDGRTYGDEHACVELARRAQRRGIGLTTLGVGTEWNEDLLETMTAGPNSRTQYITAASEIGNVFVAELNRLHATVAQSVELTLSISAETQIHACYRVQPFIAQLYPQAAGSGTWRVPIGEWAANEDQTFIVELIVPPVTTGTHSVARLDLRYELVGTMGTQSAAAVVQLPALLDEQPVASEVRRALERMVAYQLQTRAWEAVAEGKIEDATKRLRMAGTHLFNSGEVALAEMAHAEATRLLQGGSTSADGRKRIKYGTRGLIAGR
ncbi:MAG TPA: VWA domain-containing protein [Herpetosiphonaceae bacterium]